jgi:hypothetical protein
MTSFPNRESAYIPREKLTNYLLAESHPIGKSKAKFFRSLGFDETNLKKLEQGLLSIAHFGEVVKQVESSHGTKYVMDGELETPTGATVSIKTVWIVDIGQEQPRFVTAYPA